MRRQRQCTKFDIFGFCIDEHPNHWKYGGGTHGRPRPAPRRPDKPRPTPQPPLPDKPKRGDKPDKPDKPDRPGRKLTKKEREDLAITYRKLPNRPSSEMTPADVEAAHLHEAARQFEFDPSGESTNQYLRESGVDWTHLPEVSRGETGYNKGSVFQSNDGTKLRVVYTGTDTAKPSDIVADAQIASGNFRNSTHAQDAVDMYERAQAFADRAAARPGSDIRPPIIDEINGFSLGGGTAQHVGAVKGKPTRIFNPGLGPEHVADQMSGNAPPSTDIVKTQGDPVSLLTGSLESAGMIHAGGGENPVSVRQIMPLERNKTPIEKHGGDNFHDQTAARADPKGRSHYSKALDSAAELKDMRMLHDAIDAIEEGTSMLDWAAEHPNVTMERARTLWETARNRGTQQDVSVGGAVEMQDMPSMTRAPAASIDEDGNVIYDDRVVVPGAEETKTADRPGRTALDELLARPTQDEVREMRRARRGRYESVDAGVLDEALFDDLTPLEQEANNTQHLNNYHDDVAGETEDSPLLAQEESVNQMNEQYRMPGEKYAHEYQESKTPIMSQGELDGFAAQPKGERNRMMAAKADEHAGHAKNFESEVSKTSMLDHPAVKEFGANVLSGLALGFVGDEITDQIMKQPTEKEWAAMSDEKKLAYIHKREALGGAVTGGLGGGLGLATGAGAAMFLPEVAIGTTAAMLGGAVSREIGELGGGEFLQSEGGGVISGAYAGGASHAAGKAIKAFKNRGQQATEGAEGEGTEVTEMGEGLAEESEALAEGTEALAEGTEVATTAAEATAAASETAAAAETAATAAETAATAAEALATGAEVATDAAILAGGVEEGSAIGAFFAPETAGASIAIGAAAGAVISGIGLGLHKLFG